MISLTTQCPHCQTRFDVSASDLQRRKGLVRCVHCAHIFDGYESIVDGPEQVVSGAQLPQAEKPVEPTIGADIPVPADHDEPIVFDPDAFELDEPLEPEPVIDPPTPITQTTAPRAEESPQARPYRVPVPSAPLYRERKISPAQEPGFWQSLRGLLMRLLLLFLIVLAIAQLAYVFRAQIALYAPFTRPALQSMCAQLGCKVPYLREIAAIDIIYSRLSLEDSVNTAEEAAEYRYVLRLGLRNEASVAQQWPTLFITFNDASATVMARMEVPPEQYLDPWQLQGPFLPGQTMDIELEVNARAKKINGFKIEKIFS